MKVMPAHVGGCLQVALTESRPATAFATSDQRNFEANCLENLDGSNANVWLVVTNECVVPEKDFSTGTVAAVSDRRPTVSALRERRYMIPKPLIKPLRRVIGKRASIS